MKKVKESPKKEDDYIPSINAISFVLLMVCYLIMMIPFFFIIVHFIKDFPNILKQIKELLNKNKESKIIESEIELEHNEIEKYFTNQRMTTIFKELMDQKEERKDGPDI